MSLRSILATLRSIPVIRRGRTVGWPRRFGHVRQLESLEERAQPSVAGGLQVDADSWDPSSILVRFRPNTASALEGTHLGRELSIVSGLHSVRLDAGMDVDKALEAYRADPDVSTSAPITSCGPWTSPTTPITATCGACTTPARPAARRTPTSTRPRPGTSPPATAAPVVARHRHRRRLQPPRPGRQHLDQPRRDRRQRHRRRRQRLRRRRPRLRLRQQRRRPDGRPRPRHARRRHHRRASATTASAWPA